MYIVYLLKKTQRSRGVQYVHCVMHKCIRVKVGREMKNTKYVKDT